MERIDDIAPAALADDKAEMAQVFSYARRHGRALHLDRVGELTDPARRTPQPAQNAAPRQQVLRPLTRFVAARRAM